MHTYAALTQAVFDEDPYEGFTPVIDTPDIQGWNGLHPLLVSAVEDDKPRTIIDLGVWYGESTITLARAQQKACPQGYVIAIDTFLGSTEHWDKQRPDGLSTLMFKHGRPSFYEVFLSNVVLTGMTDRIVPIAQTSENAAGILKSHGVVADLIHIDASHKYRAVLQDIEIYWDLLAPGGLLIGDDIDWPDVERAVVEFTEKNGLAYSNDPVKWWVRKP